MKMRFFIIFTIFVNCLFIKTSHGFLDPETSTVSKPTKSFIRIDLDRTETVNENNFNKQHTTEKHLTSEESKSKEDTTSTMVPNVPFNATTEALTTRHPEEAITNQPDLESKRSVFWFFGGAIAGIVLSFIIFSTYSFFKSRTESIYQNL